MKTCSQEAGTSVVRQGPGHRGKGWGKGWARGPRTHPPCRMSSLLLLWGKAAVSCKPTLSRFSREYGRRSTPWMPLVIISTWIYAPLSQLNTLMQPPSRVGLHCFWVPYIVLEISLPSCSWFGNVVPYFFKIRIYWADHCPGLSTSMALNNFLSFAEDMKSGFGNSSPRRSPAGLAVAASEPLQSPHSPFSLTILSRACSFLSSIGQHMSNSGSSSWFSTPWEHVFPLPLALHPVPDTNETVYTYLRKEGRNVGAHCSWPE